MHLVGHSLGGWIAVSYALKYPEQISSLVLLAPEGVEVEKLEENWKKIQNLMKRPAWVFKILRFLRPLIKKLGLNSWLEEDWEKRQLMLQYPTGSKLLFLRQLPEIRAELVEDKLDFLTVPVLILQGEKDSPDAVAKSDIYARVIPKAELKIIARVGKNLLETSAGVVAMDIKDFVTRVIN